MRLHRKLCHPNRMICKKCIISKATRVEIKKKWKKGAIQGDDDLNIVAKRIIVYCGYDFNILQSKKCGHCVYFLTISKTAIIMVLPQWKKSLQMKKSDFWRRFFAQSKTMGREKMRLLNAIESFICNKFCVPDKQRIDVSKTAFSVFVCDAHAHALKHMPRTHISQYHEVFSGLPMDKLWLIIKL